MILVSGTLKNSLNGIVFMFMLTSFAVMQCYTEWEKHRFKRVVGIHDFGSNSEGVIEKTGPFSLVVIILIFTQLCLIIIFPGESKDQLFYMAKVH